MSVPRRICGWWERKVRNRVMWWSGRVDGGGQSRVWRLGSIGPASGVGTIDE
jgi:hypothetical protein